MWHSALGGGHDPATVRTAAQHVLDRAQYQEPASNWIGDAIKWVIDHLFPQSARASVGGGGPGIVGDLVVLALAAGVVYLIVRLVRGWRPRVKPDVPDAELTTIDVDARRSADEWADLAARFVAEGRFRDAVRARYGELVARLADDGSVASIAGRTSGELRADVALTRPGGAAAFDVASTRFERVWYGGADAGREDADEVFALGQEVLRAPKLEHGARPGGRELVGVG